jgi:hypothetical protein
MPYRQFFSILIAFVMTVSLPSNGKTKASPFSPCYGRGSNLITDRIMGKQLKHWHAIKRVALAVGDDQQPLHPTLYRLWRWAESGSHAIYIELRSEDGPLSATAGRFRIVKLDPTGKRHISVIQLYLNNIDNASTEPEVARADRLIPLKGLSKYERYAEVLGHELAHAYHVLTDLERTEKVYKLVEETNVLLLGHYIGRRNSCCKELEPEMKQRLEARDALLHELERYAEGVETVVWQELIAGKKQRDANRRYGDQAKYQLPICNDNDAIAAEP